LASREEESKIFQAATQKNAPLARFFVKGPAEEKKMFHVKHFPPEEAAA